MNAIIYARVSTEEQVHGTSLLTQVQACRAHALKLGLSVPDDHIFIEEGVSAKLLNRPKLDEMLRFCASKKGSISHCIVWKVDRLARKSEYHHVINASLRKNGVKLESATEPIDDDPMGELFSGMLAVMAQFENDVRTSRTVAGMVERTKQGGWPHSAPLGYDKWKTPSGVTSLKPSKDAPNVKELLEKFSTGNYSIKAAIDLAYSLNISNKGGDSKSWQPLKNILTNPIYAGIVKTKYTDGQELRGLHEPLISESVYRRNMEIIYKNRHVYGNVKAEWPLRGGFMVHTCGKPMTGSAPRGRNGPSPRYSCMECRQSIIKKPVSMRKEVIHDQFIAFLNSVRPSEGLLSLYKAVVMQRLNETYVDGSKALEGIHKDEAALRVKRSKVISLYVDSKLTEAEKNDQLSLIDGELNNTSLRKAELEAELEINEATVDAAIKLLERPGEYWNHGNLLIKQSLQSLIFPSGVTYDCEEGFRTAEICESYLLIKKIAPEEAKNSNLVDQMFANWNQIRFEVLGLSRLTEQVRQSSLVALTV